MIRTIKSCLYKTTGRSRINYFDLLTVISDIQNAINSRPLTYRCSLNSNLEIITPNCVLCPNVNVGLVLKMDDQKVSKADPLPRSGVIKSIEAHDDMPSKFRELWYQHYLLCLRELCRDLHEMNFQNKIDVVLVKNTAKTRPFCLLGRVQELIMSNDNKVHSVKVKRGDGSVQIKSNKLLYPLELSLIHAHHPGTVPSSEASGDEGANTSNESRENPYADSTPKHASQRPKRNKNLKGKRNSPYDPYIYYWKKSLPIS